MTPTPMAPRLLVLPGWGDSGPDHWQSRWAAVHAEQACFSRVEQDDWQWPKRGDWMMRLDEVLLADDTLLSEPAVLVAHSLGCHLVAAWAAHSRHTARVKGAWLVAPPDLDGPDAGGLPPQLQGWRAVPRGPLPFPVQALLSVNDPYSSLSRARQLAADWLGDHAKQGGRHHASFEEAIVTLGPMGHVNAASGLGDWPQGWAYCQAWLRWLWLQNR